jgi:PAS domain S-box-containing protein
MKRLSSRFHLALGLTSLVVSLLLLAHLTGLVPDRDGALRAARVSLAEAVAISSTALLADEDDSRLSQVLGFIAKRNPELQSIALRRRDGSVLWQLGEPVPADSDGNAPSTDTHLRVPLLLQDQAWGSAELQFRPLHQGADWRGSAAALVVAMGLGSFVLFYLYLRRMLRHLDPSRVIPGRVRTAFDTLAEGLLVLDPKGRIVLANSAFVEVVGGSADALVGKPAASLGWTLPAQAGARAPDTAQGSEATPWKALFSDGQARRNVLMHLVDAQGKRRTFMLNGSPVPGANGKVAGMLVSLDDVTALEEQEIQLRLARDEAESANRAKSDFLANMSHEIRTPMNAILGFAELLRRGWQHDTNDAQRHLDIILGSGRHLLALINDILDLSKVEAGRLEVERVPCAVHEVVHEVVGIMNVRAQEKGVHLVVEFPHALPATIPGDPARVRQIVTNLLGNALKFTQQGQVTVCLRLQQAAGAAQLGIHISDTGIGIAADKLEAIFEPFVQAETSTSRHFGGTGLGLAISRRFARALGGDITASSVPGQGSTFHVTLDAGKLDGVLWLEPAALAAAAQRSERAAEACRWEFAPARVLVVDDGAENRELVRLVLEASGLVVLEAENGARALETLARETVDLVLMDVQMPVMDGPTATRRLRERGVTLPVLALTAHAMKGFEAELDEVGFSGHLTKPVDIDTMLATLAQRLQARRLPAAGAPLEAAAGASPQGLLRGAPIVSRLAGHARLARVVRTFANTLPTKLQAMQAALAGGRIEELAELAHWLKGAGGTVGFDVFFEPARQFELHARAGRLADLEHGLREIQALAARIVVPEEPATAASSLPAMAGA